MEKKEPKRRNGYYYDLPGKESGEGYPSVTTILKVIAKPQLTFWIKRETAREAIRTLDEAAAIAYTDNIMKKAGNEGTTAHKIIEEYWKGNKYEKDKIADKIKVYLDAFEEFLKSHTPKLIETEGVCYSDKYQYAGTFDGLFEIGGLIWLIDWKTSNNIYKEHRIQLIAYKKALEEMGKKIDRVAIVQLKNNGLPLVEMVGEKEDEVDVFKAFIACKHLYDVLDKLK